MAKERRKIMRAGNLWIGVQYYAPYNRDPRASREAKRLITSPAKEAINARRSWEKFMLLMAANFGPRDLVCTLTYRDDNLPRTREEADKRLTAFIRKLRAARRETGDALYYIRVTEGFHAGGRFHHHLVLNSTGADFRRIRELWQWGSDLDFKMIRDDSYMGWAQYLTKEPREKGRRQIGDRTWRASVGLRKPTTEWSYVDEKDKLLPPAGANILERTECANGYGRFTTITAICQDEADNPNRVGI